MLATLAAAGMKGKLLCCKCLFDQIKANLAETQPENHQNVKKPAFLTKSSGSRRDNSLTFRDIFEDKFVHVNMGY